MGARLSDGRRTLYDCPSTLVGRTAFGSTRPLDCRHLITETCGTKVARPRPAASYIVLEFTSVTQKLLKRPLIHWAPIYLKNRRLLGGARHHGHVSQAGIHSGRPFPRVTNSVYYLHALKPTCLPSDYRPVSQISTWNEEELLEPRLVVPCGHRFGYKPVWLGQRAPSNLMSEKCDRCVVGPTSKKP